MAVLPTGISTTARTLRAFLARSIPGISENDISIAHPKRAFANPVDGKQQLNLFFYRIEHGAYPPDATDDSPWYIRVFCLVTAMGTDVVNTDNTTTGAGENELRLIGEVVRQMHAHPVIRLADKDHKEMAQLQTVLSPFTLDDINKIWSTQGDIAYRLSVAYEIALVPVRLDTAAPIAPLVAEAVVSLEPLKSLPDRNARPPDSYPFPQVPKTVVDTALPAWAPHICFIDPEHQLCYVLTLETGDAPVRLNVVVAGDTGTSVDLSWETYDRSSGWAAPSDAVTVTPGTRVIQPQNANRLAFTSLGLPIERAGQAVLYARRTYTRPSDGQTEVLHSNPLLLTLYDKEAS